MIGEAVAGRLLLADTVALHFGLAIMLGAIASCAWVRHASSSWAQVARSAASRALRAAIVGTALADTVGIWLQAELMTDAPLSQSGSAAVSMITTTHLGQAWWVGMAALAATGAAAWLGGFGQGRVTALIGASIGTVVFAFSRSIVSHAGTAGDATVSVAVDCVHLLSTCLWVGMVCTAAWSGLARATASPTDELDSIRWTLSLSATATWALAAVVVTGTYNTWRGTGALIPSSGTPYGNALLIKLVLVVIAIGLGAINRFNVLPCFSALSDQVAASAADARRTFVKVLTFEALVLLAALVAAAFLGSSEPPPH